MHMTSAWKLARDSNRTRHQPVSTVLVFANFELLSERRTQQFVQRVAGSGERSVWFFLNHGGPTSRSMMREPAEWLTGPAAPSRIEWVFKFNGVQRYLNGCDPREAEWTRWKVSTVQSAGIPLRVHVLDNGEWQEWEDQNRSAQLRNLTTACLPGVPFQPLRERRIRTHSKV